MLVEQLGRNIVGNLMVWILILGMLNSQRGANGSKVPKMQRKLPKTCPVDTIPHWQYDLPTFPFKCEQDKKEYCPISPQHTMCQYCCTDIGEWQGRQDGAKDELKAQTKLKVTQALEEIKVDLNNMFQQTYASQSCQG